MVIRIDDKHRRHNLKLSEIEKKAKRILEALEAREGELSLLIVNDELMSTLNQQYLNRSGSTNVIAFPMRQGAFSDMNTNLLGDVVISIDTAAKEAKRGGLSTELRFDQLMIHGILHLFGFDHECSKEEAQIMMSKDRSLLKMLNLKDVDNQPEQFNGK
jgi:probable rRNA maturation factor